MRHSKRVCKNKKEGENVKPIIDVCCGSKMFWFKKDNPNTVLWI